MKENDSETPEGKGRNTAQPRRRERVGGGGQQISDQNASRGRWEDGLVALSLANLWVYPNCRLPLDAEYFLEEPIHWSFAASTGCSPWPCLITSWWATGSFWMRISA